MAFLDIKNASKTFGTFSAVEDFNLEIAKGELVTFLGPSGCGKTTTLRMVAGFETPSNGQILLNGEDISRESSLTILKRGISYVPEGRSNFPYTVGHTGYHFEAA